jgi:hypothetical protein
MSQTLFPKTYDDARAQFLSSAKKIQAAHPRAEIRSFHVPSQTDQNLYVDEIYIPSKTPQSLLILTSGVHGLEASLGSAAQLQFMQTQLNFALSKGIGVWIVHCLNPYGWKYARRVTEENINLNRNFGTTPESFRTPNDGYLRLAPHIENKSKARSHLLHPLATMAFLIARVFKKEFSSRTLTQAIAQGQFTNPQGLEYGGTAPTPQAKHFRERFEVIENPYSEIMHADFHTGLGKRNRLHLLTGFDVERCVNPTTFKRLFKVEDETHLYEFNSGDEVGFYRTIGDINTLVADCAPTKKVVALTFEFGTLGTGLLANARSLSRLWLENRGTQNGFETSEHEIKIRAKFRELFEPQDPKWQANALAISEQVLKQVVDRL